MEIRWVVRESFLTCQNRFGSNMLFLVGIKTGWAMLTRKYFHSENLYRLLNRVKELQIIWKKLLNDLGGCGTKFEIKHKLTRLLVIMLKLPPLIWILISVKVVLTRVPVCNCLRVSHCWSCCFANRQALVDRQCYRPWIMYR